MPLGGLHLLLEPAHPPGQVAELPAELGEFSAGIHLLLNVAGLLFEGLDLPPFRVRLLLCRALVRLETERTFWAVAGRFGAGAAAVRVGPGGSDQDLLAACEVIRVGGG
jgi:hypothetical protein